MSRFTKILLGLVVVGVALAVSLGVMLTSSDFSHVKDQLNRMVERATGREFVIAGDLQFNFSFTPSLSVTDVHLANAKWGKHPEMIVLDRLEAEVDLMSLLKGQLNIEYVLIDGLNLYLETDGQGLANWEFDAPRTEDRTPNALSSSFQFDPTVRDVRLKNIHTVYRDGATGMTFEATLKSADFLADGYDAPLQGGLVGVFNGETFAAEASLGSFAQIISSAHDPFPINLRIHGTDITADVVAMMEHPGKGLDIQARTDIHVFDTQVLEKLFTIGDLPDLGTLNVRSKAHLKGQSLSLSGLDVETPTSHVTGSATLNMAGPRLAVEARLRSDRLDLAPFAPKGAEDPTEDKVFSNAPFDLSGFDAMDGDIEFEGQIVKLQDWSASDVRAKVRLKDGVVDIKSASLIFENGYIDLTGVLKPTAQGIDVHTQASIRNFNAGTVTKLSGQGDLVDLLMDGEVLVIAKGNSPHELAKTVNGHVKMIGRNGHINDQKVVELTESVTSVLPWVSNKDANAISCVLAEVPIADGIATAKTVVIDTSGVKVIVTGTADLGAETLELKVNTDAKRTSLASFAVPFQVNGTLLEPEVKVTTGQAVVGTLGNIVKTPAKAIAGLLSGTVSLVESDAAKKERKDKNDPCVQALKEGKTAPSADPPKQ